MSVSLPTIVVIALGAVIVMLGMAQLLLFRLARSVGAGKAAPAAPGGEKSADGDGPDSGANGDSPEIEPPDPADATAAAMTEAVKAGAEAAAAEMKGEIQAELNALRGALKTWVDKAIADAADREVSRRMEALQAEFAADLRRKEETLASAVQAAAPAAPAATAPEPAAPAPAADRAEATAGPALPGDPGPQAPPAPRLLDSLIPEPVPAPSDSRLDLTRRVPYDLLGEASKWLGLLGVDQAEMERLRANATSSDPAEGLRQLFADLHEISATRWRASDRPTLRWDSVGRERLAGFLGKIPPGSETSLIWPRRGDSFDPLTMHDLQKDESGGGKLTEVVAPGYSIGSGGRPVKALVIYA